MKSLYIFVDSERPDQYLNSVVHCVLHCDVRRVIFIHIEGLTNREAPPHVTTGVSGRVLAAVLTQLEGLAERGEYLFTSGPRAHERKLLKDVYTDSCALSIQEYYKRCRNIPVLYRNEDIDYDNLRLWLRRIAAEGSSAFVDVTAIKKRYLGDVIAAGLVEGLRRLYTFDIETARIDFERPWHMLIHDLEAKSPPHFRYINILDTPLYRARARLLVVLAPKMQVVAAVIVVLLIMGALGYMYLGPQSQVVQVVLAVSGLASILSLTFGFLVPRR